MQKPDVLTEGAKARGVNKLIDYAGLLFIGILSLGYLLYGAPFAKLHIYLPLLGAPFFIGDMIFVVCFSLFFVKWLKNAKDINVFACLLFSYLLFLSVKTFVGYSSWGPLALRHAVLFFYPLFAVFGFSFYRKDFFYKNEVLLFGILLTFIFLPLYQYFAFACLVLILVLINAYPGRAIRYFTYLALLIGCPYKIFFLTKRALMVSNALAVIFVGFGFVYLLKIKRIYKIVILSLIIALYFCGMIKISDRHSLQSLIGFEKLVKEYRLRTDNLNIVAPVFVEEKLGVRLYCREEAPPGMLMGLGKGKTCAVPDEEKIKAPAGYSDIDDETLSRGKLKHRDIKMEETPIINSIFRVFIWKEALGEIFAKHPLFGFDFGKPFRCRALEALNWTSGEWSRDGWICMHNSYIDMVYRAGIIGVLIAVFAFAMLFSLIKRSFQIRSLTGILLTGALLSWFLAAFFAEILEMPYSAIPLWSLFGLTAAHLLKGKAV